MSRILIIDPDLGLRGTLELIVRMAGYDAWAATDGRQALALARAHPPDAIVLATRLPGLDGPGFVAAYRAELGTHAAPVVMMTHDRHEEARARETGADAILPMPFDAADLLAAVRRIARPSAADDPAREVARPSVPSAVGVALPP